MKKYNVIFLFSDQQRWDTCGCYGQPLDVTPHLDKMAQEGIVFENAYTCQPVCGPARSSLQTGLYPSKTGCYRNDIALPDNCQTIAHLLNDNGYKTGYIGKWHLASTNASEQDSGQHESCPEDAVFIDRKTMSFLDSPIPEELRGGWKDQWLASDVLEFTSHSYDGYMFDKNNKKRDFSSGRYRVDVQTDWVLETIDSWKDDADPFFLFASYIEPHHQNDHKRYEGPIGSAERFRNFIPPEDLKNANGDWKEGYPDYLGCIHSLDDNLGRIRQKLKENGQEENTIIIFASDHGSHFKTRNSEYKRSCHNASTHIPIVMYHPDLKESRRVDNMVSLIDLPATFLDLCGVEVPEHYHGRSLVSLLEGVPVKWEDEVLVQISESQVGRSIRTPNWCYSVSDPEKDGWCHDSSRQYIEEFLYDQKADPHEQKNLILDPDFEHIRARMKSILIEHMVRIGEDKPEIYPAQR